jgi:protoporphyrinogen oxidase
LAHDLETKEKYKADRDKYLHEIKEEVIDSIEDDLDAIHQLQKDVAIMAESAKDVLREKIMVIYHKGKRTKSMPLHQREALN